MTMDVQVGPAARANYLSSPSLVCDLSWALSVAMRPEWRPNFPFVASVFDAREELAERIRQFWPEHADVCFTEMQVLAHHAGALGLTSPDALWSALAAAVATVPTDIELASETPEERAIFLGRLEQFKASPALFESYLSLLREVWEPLNDTWQAAVPMLEESGRQVVEQLEAGRPLEELMGESCQIFRSMLDDIRGRVAAGQPLLVVPCLFFGKSLYLEFPGLTLLGSGFRRNDIEARARTEALAKRLKTVADPTRLAILHFLAFHPSTVGDLAITFGLAQPTVSMHTKSLRDTGLVLAERHGGRLQLTTDPQAMEALLHDLRHVVIQGDSITGSVRNPATVVDGTRSASPVTA
jgi:DNA-binding transcriptional ArsR family regulator